MVKLDLNILILPCYIYYPVKYIYIYIMISLMMNVLELSPNWLLKLLNELYQSTRILLQGFTHWVLCYLNNLGKVWDKFIYPLAGGLLNKVGQENQKLVQFYDFWVWDAIGWDCNLRYCWNLLCFAFLVQFARF